MNKQELVSLVKGSLEFRDDENVLRLEDLHKFFESNICIPKGTEVKVPIWNNGYAVCKVENLVIKPHEPVYEYLWYNANGDTKWMTLDESKEFERPWFWTKETSRMRQ